jgi:hypothetical protein
MVICMQGYDVVLLIDNNMLRTIVPIEQSAHHVRSFRDLKLIASVSILFH